MSAMPSAEIDHTALIVDDNWYNRDIFRIALETAGYQVTQVDNGSEGLAILEKEVFNLLVLDLHMPGVDGSAILQSLQASPSARDKMRIVVVTANAHMATSEVEDVADYVMYKPINVMDFSRFVKRLMR